LKPFLKAFQDPSQMLAEGLYLGGEKYIPHKYDNRSIYARKVRCSERVKAENIK
jgi:hypothetical protein